MKTKNIILTAGLLGLGYLIYKKSKLNNQDSQGAVEQDSSGGGGSIGGGMMPIVNPIIAGVVVPINPRPIKTQATIIGAELMSEKELPPRATTSTTNSTTTGGTVSTPTFNSNTTSVTPTKSVLMEAEMPRPIKMPEAHLPSEPILANASIQKEAKSELTAEKK